MLGAAREEAVWLPCLEAALRTCAELEKPHRGGRLWGGRWRETGSRIQVVPCTPHSRWSSRSIQAGAEYSSGALLIHRTALTALAILKFSPEASGGLAAQLPQHWEMPSALRTQTGEGF